MGPDNGRSPTAHEHAMPELPGIFMADASVVAQFEGVHSVEEILELVGQVTQGKAHDAIWVASREEAERHRETDGPAICTDDLLVALAGYVPNDIARRLWHVRRYLGIEPVYKLSEFMDASRVDPPVVEAVAKARRRPEVKSAEPTAEPTMDDVVKALVRVPDILNASPLLARNALGELAGIVRADWQKTNTPETTTRQSAAADAGVPIGLLYRMEATGVPIVPDWPAPNEADLQEFIAAFGNEHERDLRRLQAIAALPLSPIQPTIDEAHDLNTLSLLLAAKELDLYIGGQVPGFLSTVRFAEQYSRILTANDEGATARSAARHLAVGDTLTQRAMARKFQLRVVIEEAVLHVYEDLELVSPDEMQEQLAHLETLREAGIVQIRPVSAERPLSGNQALAHFPEDGPCVIDFGQPRHSYSFENKDVVSFATDFESLWVPPTTERTLSRLS